MEAEIMVFYVQPGASAGQRFNDEDAFDCIPLGAKVRQAVYLACMHPLDTNHATETHH
jgi:hypothetical protein